MSSDESTGGMEREKKRERFPAYCVLSTAY